MQRNAIKCTKETCVVNKATVVVTWWFVIAVGKSACFMAYSVRYALEMGISSTVFQLPQLDGDLWSILCFS